jgi:ketosteroid isomerase-like protein
VRSDAAPFEQSLAADFAFVTPDGNTQDRAGFLGDMRNGNLKIASTVPDSMQVRVYGDAAVVTYHSTDRGTYKGTDISGQYRWTDVFVKQGGQWKIVASQGTPIPPPQPAPAPPPTP